MKTLLEEMVGGQMVELGRYEGRLIMGMYVKKLPGNVLVSGVTKWKFPNTFALMYHVPTLGYMIQFDEWFYNMPDNVQDALLKHEIGHIESGHMKGGVKTLVKNLLRNVGYSSLEYEADAKSVEKGGEMLDALDYMEEHIPGINKKDLNARRKKLRKGVKK